MKSKKLTKKDEEKFDRAFGCAGFDYLEEMQKVRLWGFDPEETQKRVEKFINGGTN